MLINKKNIKKLRVAHTESSRTRVKSLSFLYTGEKLIFNTDEKISILSLGERVTVHVIKPKNGAGLCRFFDVATVLHSSITIHEVKLLHVVNGRENKSEFVSQNDARECKEICARVFSPLSLRRAACWS